MILNSFMEPSFLDEKDEGEIKEKFSDIMPCHSV
jgi:hypothetical protein